MYRTRWEQIVNPGRMGEYLAYQHELTTFLSGRPGFGGRRIARHLGEPRRFRAWAQWESQEASEEVLQSADMRGFVLAQGAAELATLIRGPESYELVYSLQGQASQDQPPGVVAERTWVVRPGAGLAAEFVESRKKIFDVVVGQQPSFWGHSLYRYRGAFNRFLVLNAWRTLEDSFWSLDRQPIPEVAELVLQFPEERFTDVHEDFELWEPVPLT